MCIAFINVLNYLCLLCGLVSVVHISVCNAPETV